MEVYIKYAVLEKSHLNSGNSHHVKLIYPLDCIMHLAKVTRPPIDRLILSLRNLQKKKSCFLALTSTFEFTMTTTVFAALSLVNWHANIHY